MDANRLSRGLGWWSVGLGLTELVLAERFCERLGFRGRIEWVRAHGVREVLKGWGLLTRPDPRPWLRARLAGDVFDLSVLGVTLRRREVPIAWRFAVALTAVGLTLVDVLVMKGLGARRSDVIGMALSPEPGESWRDSGLARDAGVESRHVESRGP